MIYKCFYKIFQVKFNLTNLNKSKKKRKKELPTCEGLTYYYSLLLDAAFHFVINQVCEHLTHPIDGLKVLWAVVRYFKSVEPHIGDSSFHRSVGPVENQIKGKDFFLFSKI